MMPYIETQRADKADSMMEDEDVRADFMVNNLIYRQPQQLTLAKSRSLTPQIFQQNSYLNVAGNTLTCDWNTGASFVNTSGSYLVFELKVTTATSVDFDFGSGSAMNLFNRLTIRTRSGTEVDRIDNLNLFSSFDIKYNKSKQWKSTVGSGFGYGVIGTDIVQPTTGATIKYMIPLTSVSTFFESLKPNQPMPPNLASGLHIELVAETNGNAVKCAQAVTSYDISNIHFQLDLIEMSGDVQKTISAEAASSGLEWTCRRIYTNPTQLTSGTVTANIQIVKSVAQFTRAFAVPQLSSLISGGTAAELQAEDAMASSYSDFTSLQWQYHVGSIYQPLQIISDSGAVSHETYYASQHAMDRLRHHEDENAVSMKSFVTGADGIIAASFNKNDDLLISGIPINNSRGLSFDLTFTATTTGARRIITFLEYIQVTKAWSNNVAVAV